MRFSSRRLVLTLALAPVSLASLPAQAKDLDAAIAGGIIGLAAGAALSHHHHHDNNIYYPGYAPPYAPGGYGPYYGQSFSPNPGIICYPAQRACYNAGGDFAGKWTNRIFGY